MQIKAGSTSVTSARFAAWTTATGAAVTVTSATAGLNLWYKRAGAAKVVLGSVNDLATEDAAYNAQGIKVVSGQIHRIDLPDAAVLAGAGTVEWGGEATGITIDGGSADLIGQATTGAVGSVATQSLEVLGAAAAAVATLVVPDPAGTGAAIVSSLATAHGAGSWATATGFATPADITTAIPHPLTMGQIGGAGAWYVEALNSAGAVIGTSTQLEAILEDTGVTLPAQIAVLDIEGTGAYACTWTVNDGSTALQGATIAFYMAGVLKGQKVTNASGQASMSLDAGTYTVAISCAGYTFSNEIYAVSATASTWTHTFSMALLTWPPSTTPGMTTVRWRVRKTNRDYASTAECTIYMGIAKGPGVAGTIYNGDNLDYEAAATDSDGYVYFAKTPKGATVAVKTATDGQVQFVQIPRDCGDTFEGSELIGSS